MPSQAENQRYWDEYDWPEGGHEWSQPWGSARMQWQLTILPRISSFLPCGTILEIAPGRGRWTEFLRDHCQRLIAVDSSPRCIAACRETFAADSRLSFFSGDGYSLPEVADASIDFAFSFDSLVHCDEAVIRAYTQELARVLKPNGVAFIHHSNLGQYGSALVAEMGESEHARDPGMTARKQLQLAKDADLRCLTQELITWSTREALIDCFSTLVRADSHWRREFYLLRNSDFMREASMARQLGQFYLHPRQPITG